MKATLTIGVTVVLAFFSPGKAKADVQSTSIQSGIMASQVVTKIDATTINQRFEQSLLAQHDKRMLQLDQQITNQAMTKLSALTDNDQ